DQQLLTDTAASLTITAPGTYVYAYRHHHCVHADTIVATAPPVAKASDFIACLNTSGQLIADSIPYATYFWDGIPSTSPILPITTTLGSKQISLVIRDSYGCKDSTLVKVEGIPEPQFNLSHNNVCEGTLGKISVALIDPSIESIYQIESQWRSNNIPISPSNWKVLSFNNSGEYHLQLRIGNCVSEKKTNVLVFPKPIIDMPTEHKYCYEDAEAIRLESNSFAKYKWYSKEGLMDTSRSIEVRPLVRSTYRLTVENQYGCKDSIPVTIHVSCPPRLDVPNVITPESKDINATMNVYGAFYTDFELTIFNRWGEVIFESRDPKTVWDGTYRGEPMPIGVYPWIISYDAEYEEYKRPMKYKKQGDVTVVR
ncbi:MAG TPA: gliding motility-associated C-terminal domain-containing protein, partial [Cytophagales bacterium]|nr:gliding motility-associated C-terminal domain-containing protein [Cytophagales bacterium]